MRGKLFLIGLLMYVASFWLVAVRGHHDSNFTSPGYECASVMLIYSWQAAKSLLHPSIRGVTEYISGTITGLTNPVFLAAVTTRSHTLRIIVILMMPFCWIVFYWDNLYPREGYFLWLAGMLFVLFSERFTTGEPTLRADKL
jgi:hypothetical protein